ncbi:MAG: nuclear transport factor 2 family protein [Actinobacteria bacterium]|nr:nuclear transport factor 2 family protein [Actinomycetota bacterium]
MNTSTITPTPTPSAGPRQVTLELYAALLAGQLEDARRHTHDDVVLHVPGSHPLAGDHRGPDALVRFVEASRERTDTGENLEVIDVLEGAGHAAVYLRVTATRAGKVPLDNTTVHLLRVVDGRVAEVWLHNWDDLTVNEFWS